MPGSWWYRGALVQTGAIYPVIARLDRAVHAGGKMDCPVKPGNDEGERSGAA